MNKIKCKTFRSNNTHLENKRNGYLIVECLIYICISCLILSSILLILSSARKIQKHHEDLFDLNEIAIKTEDIIRFELESSISCMINKNYIDDKQYHPITSIDYLAYDNYLTKNFITEKSIVSSYGSLYIKNDRMFQVSNYLKRMLIKPSFDEDKELISLSIILVFSKNNSNLKRNFTVFFN